MRDPIESHPWPDSCVTRETSASDDPVNVEIGLVFAEVRELHDWTGALILRRGLFSKKNPNRTCSSSWHACDLFWRLTGLTLPPSSSGKI